MSESLGKPVEVKYKKSENATKVEFLITCEDGLNLLDVLRAFSSIMDKILSTGEY